MRRIFVGDIQGCREQLLALLEAVEFVRGHDLLVPVGDMVNKGPDSAGVLAVLMDLGAEPVLGNHDLEWLAKGAGDALQLKWLRSLPLVRVYDDLVAVHAGLHPDWDEGRLQAMWGGHLTFN